MNKPQKKIIESFTGFGFKLYLLKNLPMGFIAGLKIESVSDTKCVTSVPFNWLTKNPFKSMYFAVQSMAAELSTATTCLMATIGENPSVAFIIVDCKAVFLKKATSKVEFVCSNAQDAFLAVEECKKTEKPITRTFKTIGTQEDGVVVSEFEFTWSFKKRSS